MSSPVPFCVLICSICGKRVNVESRRTDEDGRAIHEECYLSQAHGKYSEGPVNWETQYDVNES